MTDTLPAGTPSWLDLSSTDPDASAAFYAALFGWDCSPPAEAFGGYRTYLRGEAPVAGMMAAPPGHGSAWMVWLATGDAAAHLAKAVENGAQSVIPATPVGELGVMAMFSDPAGAFTGLWQPGTHRGSLATGWGTPVWYELAAHDFDAAAAFYAAVFGVEVQLVNDSPPMRYAQMGAPGQVKAGLMDAAVLPAGVPSHWAVYFGVPDVAAAVEQAVALGATVLRPAEDTPWGWMASLRDPQGAVFKLMTPRPA